MSSVPRYDFTINVKTKKCCCCKFATFIDAELTLCNHWVVKPLRPILISTYFLILLATAIADVFLFSDIYDQIKYNNFKINLPWVAIIVIFVLFICTTSSFYAVMCRGPGYAPYDWSVKKDVNISFEETVKRFAVYQQQVDFAKAGEQPPRSCFSTPARRFILRADHYCLWSESWIGYNNARYFILMTGYFVLFCLAFLASHYWWAKYQFVDHKSDITKAENIVVIVIVLFIGASAFFSGMFSLYHFSIFIHHLVKNVTSIEIWRAKSTGTMDSLGNYNRGCLNNFTEVCGKKYYCPLWCIPCFCFKPEMDKYYNSLSVHLPSGQMTTYI